MWNTYLIVSFIAVGVTAQSPNPKPVASTWARHGASTRHKLGEWLVKGSTASSHIEYEGYDGFYNNMARPDLGAVDTPLFRRIPAAYEDGVYQPSGMDRPQPLDLSQKLMNGPIGSQSRLGRNALLVFFGQQVVEEILDAQRPACPPEYFNVKIPHNHTFYKDAPKHTVMPLLRTRYDARTGYSPNNPRQQLNEITPWLDGGLTYGTTKTWSDQLRTYANGTLDEYGQLAASHDGLFPEYNTIRLPMANPPPPACHATYVKRHSTERVDRFFKLGNPRGNENPFLLSFGVLWFRWHNYLAKEIKKANPQWNGEKIYNEARKWVIASHQHIVVNKWLPMWLNATLDDYTEYDPSIDPQIDQFFQSAAFRFGHTLVPPGVYLRDYARNGCLFNTLNGRNNDRNGTVRTCNSFWQPQTSILTPYKNDTKEVMDIDRLLMGMALQLSEAEDHKIVEDLRGNVFGPLEFSRRDLMAVNIQRGRDHGLPDYNTIRRALNLTQLTRENIHLIFPNVATEFRKVFLDMHNADLSNVDLWVGGLLETGDGPGPLFTKIIKDQFRRIRDGDRFWFKNKQNGLFTDDEIARLESLEFYDIIMAVTKMNHDDIQPNVFKAPSDTSQISPACHPHLVTSNCTNVPCLHLPQLNNATVRSCTVPGTYDYFTSSEPWFIGTYVGVGVVILSFLGLVQILVITKRKEHTNESNCRANKARQSFRGSQNVPHAAREWVDHKTPLKEVIIVLYADKKQIQVRNQLGNIDRAIDVTHTPSIQVYLITDKIHVMLRVSHDYDLVLKFTGEYARSCFVDALEVFISQVGIGRERVSMPLVAALKQVVTRKCRQKRLEIFFRVVFSQAFNIQHSEKETLQLDSEAAKEVIYTELTIYEFAEALSMRADSEFVQKMFTLADKDKNGFMSFREFCDMLIIFANGNAEDKAKLMFDMYDINGTKKLTKQDFSNMIKSFMEIANANVKQEDLESVINHMLLDAGLANQEAMDVKDFQRLLLEHEDKLNYAVLNFPNVAVSEQAQLKLPSRKRSVSFVEEARRVTSMMYIKKDRVGTIDEHSPLAPKQSIDIDQETALTQNTQASPPQYSIFRAVSVYIENSFRDLFWLSLYTLVLLAIFAERAYYYSVEREHSGLRRIAGYGVTVTRGAASAMMFTYSSLLVTMCRNTITHLRDTFLHVYFPFDSAVFMHKYIACWALFFTIMHVVGHAFNFYSIATQTSNDLSCLFRNFFHSTHEIPKFQYWCWQTITGVTGILLTLVTALIFIFAMPFARRKLYNAFWFTHSLYPLFYILMILHGTGRLVQPPFTHYFFLGPCILFLFDRILTMQRKDVVIPVLKAELLPSDVTMLEFQKPNNFDYKSGQWVRIACLELNSSEYHPFTISSAPNEKNVTVHIRAVGPWTKNIRRVYDPNLHLDKKLPKIHLDGPYGEGHQDWYQSDVAVLVGGGIGVTPFASILKDIVFRKNINQQSTCKKVYFLWVTKTQKQFEWLVDIIQKLEEVDEKEIVSVHIYITQFYQKFDLRTILLHWISGGILLFESYRPSEGTLSLWSHWCYSTGVGYVPAPGFPSSLLGSSTSSSSSTHLPTSLDQSHRARCQNSASLNPNNHQYICERHFQKVCNRSLFTGLKAVTHFGRPSFVQFFKSLKQANPQAQKVGVFSCGPPRMTSEVDKDCVKFNKENESGPIFQHHSKNF